MTEPLQGSPSLQALARAMTSLLDAAAPEQLGALRRSFPSEADLFDPTFVLGPNRSAVGKLPPVREQAMRALIEATLDAGDRSVPAIVSGLSGRMRRVRSIRLGAALATAIAGALTAAPALGAALPIPSLLGPGFAFIGTIAILIAEYQEKPLAGTQNSLGELLANTLVSEAAFVDARLRLAGDDLSGEGALLDLARRVSEAAARLRHVSVFGGVTMTSGAGPAS
jgi:hypothetical protein